MKDLLVNQITPIVATAIVAILVAIIKNVGNATIEVLGKKKEEVEQKIKLSGHEAQLNAAKEVWNIVEEKFRITENATQILGSKSDEFDKLLLQKIPGLSTQNLDDLRQAIAGEVNKGKAILTDDQVKQQQIELQDSNAKLVQENAELKSKLNQVQSLVVVPKSQN